MIQSEGEMEDLGQLDPMLVDAVAMAAQTQSMTPVIKHELKLTILERRHRRGEGEPPKEHIPETNHELTPEEKKKKLKRKEQNRRAAQRCREKKRKEREIVEKEFLLEQKKTEELQKEIEILRRQKNALQQAYDDHIFSCTQTPNQTPSFDEQRSFTFPPYQPEMKQWDFAPSPPVDNAQLPGISNFPFELDSTEPNFFTMMDGKREQANCEQSASIAIENQIGDFQLAMNLFGHDCFDQLRFISDEFEGGHSPDHQC